MKNLLNMKHSNLQFPIKFYQMKINTFTFGICFIIVLSFFSTINAQSLLNIEGPLNTQINMRSGNFFYQRVDLFYEDQSMPIDITFSYNTSLDTINYGFGYGWIFPYAMNYQLDSVDNVIVSRVAGRRDTFLLNGTDYVPPMNVFDELVKYDGNKYRLTTKYGLEYLFEDATHKKLTHQEDAKGNSIALSYQNGEVVNLLHSNGRGLDLIWDNGLLSQIDDNNGSSTYSFQYVYDQGNLVEVVDPLGFSEKYNYDNSHNLIEILDKNETPIVIKYSGDQKIRKLITCFGEESFTFSQNKSFRIRQGEQGPMSSKYEFNELGLLIKITDPNNATMLFEHDENGKVTKFTDFNGNVSTSLYDAMGNKIRQTDPSGFTSNYSFTSENQVQSISNRNGHTSFYEYDAENNIIKITHPDGTFQAMTYDAYGNVESFTSENGEAYSFTYNSFGNLTSIVYPVGTETFEYDSRGNMNKITNAVNEVTIMEHDARNRVISVEDNLGRVRNYTYDGNGNVTSENNLNGVVFDYTYDPMNRLASVTIEGATTSYEYNHLGNLTSIKDPSGGVTSYTYDDRGLLESESDPLGNAWSYQYDKNQNLLSKISPSGVELNYGHDAQNRISSKTYEAFSESFTYDKIGNLINAVNDDVNISYSYDSRNRLISKKINNWNKTVSYTYDEVGNRTSMIDPNGNLTSYTYDAGNRLTSVVNSFGTTTFQYNSTGRMTRQDNPNGTYVTYTYSDVGRLTQISNFGSDNSIVSSYAYTYDNAGNRLSKTDHNGNAESYYYDNSNRLDSVEYANGSVEIFSYDASGNRINRNKDSVTELYSYNSANYLESVNDTTYSYDENGSLIRKEAGGAVTDYAYGPQNRLTQIIHPSGSITVYKYDPFGNKISKIDSSGNEVRYFHDFQNVLMEMDPSGLTQTLYASGVAPDSWMAMSRDGLDYFYHKDGLGSITELTNTSEAVVKSYDYDVFGNINGETGTVQNPYTFTGREKEIDSDLYYYRTRFYDPAVGRFTSKDKYFGELGLPATLHKYAYVENNPTSYIDVNGEIAFIPLLWYGGAALAGYAAGTYAAAYQFAHSDAHTKRCEHNQLPNTSDPGSEEGWERSPDDVYHQPDPDNPTNEKWLKPDGTGGSYEAILQPDGSYDTSSPYQGTYNYVHPTGMKWPYATPGNIGHFLYDVLPHEINPNYEDCDDDDDDDPDDDDDDGDEFDIPRLHAVDPNEISGPLGYDTAQWVSINDNLGYTVFYENDPEFATAPAQVVKINVPVHPNLNIYSVRLSDFGFGSFNFSVPENSTYYQDRLDVRDSLNVYVDVTAGIDVLRNEIFWILESIDPETNLPPEDALTGFLPVNDTTTLYNDTIPKQGEGYVNYTIKPQSSLLTGDTVTAQASIIFDINAPLLTNIWTNLVDAFAPTSEMDTILNNIIPGTSIELSWQGTDDPGGVGIDYYNLFMSKDSSPYLLIAEQIDTTVYLFEGAPGSEYYFYTRATDNVGNVEDEKYLLDEKVTFGEEDADISILQPNIDPDGFFCEQDEIIIAWEQAGPVQSVDVRMSADSGSTFPIVIALDTSMSAGPISYSLLGLSGTGYVIQISDNGPSGITATTDVFTVHDSLSIYCTNVLSCSTSVIQHVTCPGGEDGILKVDFPPYQGVVYSIAPELGNSYPDGTVTDLPAGNYTITVINDEDITEVCTEVSIAEPDPISCSLDCNGCDDNTIYVSSPGAADGIINITASGGNGVYFYEISPSLGNDQDNGLFTDMPVGIYTIQVTDGNGCVQECMSVHVADVIDGSYVCPPTSNALTDADICLDEFITLYANPVVNEFRIKGILDDYFIEILNSDGTLFQTISTIDSYEIIDLNNLPAGLYFISILHKTNNQLSMQKIIKY